MDKWHMIIDVALCEDCNACMLSCKDEYCGNEFPGYSAAQPRHGHRWMDITRKERGRGTLLDVTYRPKPCLHCANTPCASRAPEGAVRRRQDGIVVLDPDKARDQRQIVESCPYGAIGWNPEASVPQKCTFCAHLLDQGWKEPRCVQACPTGALRVVKLSDQQWAQVVKDDALCELEPALATRPAVQYKNLYRFTKLLIAGSISCVIKGRNECAEGVRVTLNRDGRQVAETVTDNYGDFKFDGLDEASTGYSLGFESKVGTAASRYLPPLTKSVVLDDIVLT